MARSSEPEPKTRSTAVAAHLTSPVARSRPSYRFSAEADAFHSVPMSSRFTKSLRELPGDSHGGAGPVPAPAERDRPSAGGAGFVLVAAPARCRARAGVVTGASFRRGAGLTG